MSSELYISGLVHTLLAGSFFLKKNIFGLNINVVFIIIKKLADGKKWLTR